MRTNTEEQDTSTSSKCTGCCVCLSAFLCIAGIALVAVLATFVVLYKECPDCPSFITDDSKSIWIFSSVATVLLISGGCIIVALVLRGRRLNSLNNSFRREAISAIPAEDLEKSAAPVLSCNRVAHCPMSIDLPDYFTAVQNIHQVCSSVDAEVSSENCPETPPPTYEEALEMADFHKLDNLFM